MFSDALSIKTGEELVPRVGGFCPKGINSRGISTREIMPGSRQMFITPRRLQGVACVLYSFSPFNLHT
jgi:hypothetical protein